MAWRLSQICQSPLVDITFYLDLFMKSKLYLLAAAIGMIASSSCKKLDSKPITQPKKMDTDVYAVGYTYTSNGYTQIASYWKNGILNKVSDSTGNAYLKAIAAHDTDVVMDGTQEHANFTQTAFYYRNGQTMVLSDNAFVGGGQSVAFSPCGCDVYICGAAMVNGHYKAVYWKNGVQYWLPGNSPQTNAFSIAVHGNDVYIAGTGVTTKNTTYAIYWKNDIAFALTDTLANSQATGISVNNNGEVYIAGYTSGTNGEYHDTYWKNGTANLLDNGQGGYLSSIVAMGNDFYTTGTLGYPTQVGYWKNNVFTNFSTGTNQVNAYGMTVFGNNVYVAGVTIKGPKPLPNYWKNGTLVALPGNEGAATDITLVTHPQ